jgi:hypothetical protein
MYDQPVSNESAQLRTRTSTTFVKKKAALTLLRLFRKHPSVMPLSDWAERIVMMMDDSDPGVALTVTALVTAMAQADLDVFSGCYAKAVSRLDRVRQTETKAKGRSSSMEIIQWNMYITRSPTRGCRSNCSDYFNTTLHLVRLSSLLNV